MFNLSVTVITMRDFTNSFFIISNETYFTPLESWPESVGGRLCSSEISELRCCAIADEVMHFSMTSHHEIFDSAASPGMLGHLGGGTPQRALCCPGFRDVLLLFSAPNPNLQITKPLYCNNNCTLLFTTYYLGPYKLVSQTTTRETCAF